MKFGKYVLSIAMVLGFFLLAGSPAMAHNAFKKEMAKKYPTMKVTCNACHVDKKPKTERNMFGKLFHKQFADKELTKNWKAKKGAEKKEFETKVMVPAFTKALEKVSAMTYAEIIKEGMVAGIEAKEEDDAAAAKK